MRSRARRFMHKLVKFEEVPVHGGNFVTVTAPMLFKTTSKFVARDQLENEFVTKMVGSPPPVLGLEPICCGLILIVSRSP